MAMGQRIGERLAELGWKQSRLVALVPGLALGTLHALIKRDSIKSEFSGQIAQALGVTHLWLSRGEGPKFESAELREVRVAARVPVLSWAEVAMLDATDSPVADDGREWAGAQHSRPGRQAFALRLDSDSMTAPAGSPTSFPAGRVLICDPEREPQAGQYVIARDPRNGHATFRRLSLDAGCWYLVPLNPAYPTLALESLEGAVIAVVIEWQAGGAV